MNYYMKFKEYNTVNEIPKNMFNCVYILFLTDNVFKIGYAYNAYNRIKTHYNKKYFGNDIQKVYICNNIDNYMYVEETLHNYLCTICSYAPEYLEYFDYPFQNGKWSFETYKVPNLTDTTFEKYVLVIISIIESWYNMKHNKYLIVETI